MPPTTGSFSLPTLVRKKIEKRRRKEKDARIHKRLSALLWLNQGYAAQEIARLLDVSPRTIQNWTALYLAEGLEALCSLEYKGDPG
jgi:transposase